MPMLSLRKKNKNIQLKIKSFVITFAILSVPLISYLLIYAATLYAEVPANLFIPQITEQSCSANQQESYNKKIISISERIPSSIPWQNSAKITIPVACQNNFKSWLAGLVFNLNLFALQRETPAETIEAVIPFLQIRTFGKDEYLYLLDVWQNSGSRFYEDEKLRDLFYAALQNKYRAAAIRGANILYYGFILQDMNHEAAKQKALQEFFAYRNGQDINFAEHKALELLRENFSQDTSVEKLWRNMQDYSKEKFALLEKELRTNRMPQKTATKKKFRKKKKNQELAAQTKKDKLDKENLMQESNNWLNTPYRYGGNSSRGIDTASFVARVLHKQKAELVFPRAVSSFYNLGNNITMDEIQEGDLVFLSYSSEKLPTHVGIYLGEQKFIFASSNRGVITADLQDSTLQQRVVGIKRIF